MSELIMAIDPGETTGWAFGRASTQRFKLEAHGEIVVADLKGFTAVLDTVKYHEYLQTAFTLMEIMQELRPKVVIIEDFVLRQFTTMKQEGISPARSGAMLMVWLYEIMPHEKGFADLRVVWQTPSQMAVINNERLKALGLYQRGFPHACDAIRHCEVYRRKMSS